MVLVNLQVEDVILHEVFKRTDDQKVVAPQYGSETEVLDVEAIGALRDRIITAMTSSTRCIQMAIVKTSVESMVTRVAQLIDADEPLYISTSKGIADKLADEQKSRAIPGGVLVVFRGTAGAPPRRLVGVIKAELHNGFARDSEDGRATMKFLKSLMLTARTKIYKVGLFIEADPVANPVEWNAFIYDDELSPANRDNAAKYFYDGFLGLGFQESSARQTKQFHELTKGFIQAMSLPEEDKVVLHNALVTYLKADQMPTVGITSFADAYFAMDEIKEAYHDHMVSKGFPDIPINKDISEVDGLLRLRRITFCNKIKVTGPAYDFDKLVGFASIDGDPGVDGVVPKWTLVTIKDQISGQD